ncbi:hypothetical protein WDW37_13775 [Bdellovibrionota bacterium FG-1]
MNQSEPKKEKKTPRELFEEIRRNQKPSPELIDGLKEIKRNEEQKEKDKQPESPERKIARPQTPPDLDL